MVAADVAPRLKIFFETVPLNATTTHDGTAIVRVGATQRAARNTTACNGYDIPPSSQIEDWYAPQPSARFDKTHITFTAPVFIDTSYNGDLLALAGAPFLQGVDELFDGDTRGIGNSTLGQAITMTLQIAMDAEPVSPPEPPAPHPPWPEWGADPFRFADAVYWGEFNLTFAEFWTRRRSFSSSSTAPQQHRYTAWGLPQAGLGNFHPPPVNTVAAGDVSLMVWMDYHWGYVWPSKAVTKAQVRTASWRGGYNLETLRGAEVYSRLAYDHFKSKAPAHWRTRMRLDSTHLGTCTGLAKMPYIRDGRRSVGLGNFTLNLTGKLRVPGTPVATAWDDRVGIAQHGMDMWGHRMMPSSEYYPPFVANASAWCDTNATASGQKIQRCTPEEKFGCPCTPAFIPLRAHTNAKVKNLLVAGYTTALSFMAESALRMHPIEWSTGVSAGAVASFMTGAHIHDTAALLEPSTLRALQARLREQHIPLEWTIDGQRWPKQRV